MDSDFEAIVRTDYGIYRAFLLTPSTVYVTQDGIEGIIDHLQLTPEYQAMPAEKMLIPALIYWIYEMRRGEDITGTKLRRRSDTGR